ncbi:hypothetical protein ACVIEM_005362 [Rhizobium leguminosarum]
MISLVLLPIANVATPIEFAPAEMAMLPSLKGDDTFNLLVSLDRIHNSIIPVWPIYEAKREAIPKQGNNHVFDKTQGRGEFDVEKGSHLEASIYEVETLAKELARRAKVDFAEADLALKTAASLDRFDAAQLATVLHTCRQHATASAAGRALFAISRLERRRSPK